MHTPHCVVYKNQLTWIRLLIYVCCPGISTLFNHVCLLILTGECFPGLGSDSAYYNGSRGNISSPNYPNSYYNRLNCDYYITVPQGMYVILTVQDFESEFGFDKLYVSDQDSLTSLTCNC